MLRNVELQNTVRREIDDPMTGRVGVHVVDLDQGEEIISHAADDQFLIASLTKIFTIGAAFEHLGSETTFTTRIVSSTPLGSDGILNGDLFVIGGGDPTLGDRSHIRRRYNGQGTSVDRLVNVIKQAGIERVTGELVGDSSLFSQEDARSTNWITALSFNRTKSEKPVLSATESISQSLIEAGVKIDGGVREGKAPLESVEVGVVDSPPVRDLAVHAGHESDNFVSEILTKHIAASTTESGEGSTTLGCAAITEYANEWGAKPRIFNGSGLRLTRLGETVGNMSTPRDVVNFLQEVRRNKNYSRIEEAMPRAASDGTLEKRMRNTSAVGSVRAKTGTLTFNRKPLQDALAGYSVGPHGALAFALIFEKADSRFVARSSLDRLVDSFAQYCGSQPA